MKHVLRECIRAADFLLCGFLPKMRGTTKSKAKRRLCTWVLLIYFFTMLKLCWEYGNITATAPVSLWNAHFNHKHSEAIMIVHSSFLLPSLRGGDLRIWRVIQGLVALQYPVSYCYLKVGPSSIEYESMLQLYSLGIEIIGPMPETFEPLLTELRSKSYIMVLEWLWPDAQYLLRLSEKVNPIFTLHSPQTAIVTVSDDIMHKRIHHEISAGFSEISADWGAADFKELERFFLAHADITVGITKSVLAEIRRMIPAATTAEVGFTILPEKVSSDRLKENVAWIGYNNPSNRAAVKWILEQLDKHADQSDALFKVHVIGGVEDMGCKLHPLCIYHGPVPENELREIMNSVRWMIAPVFSPAGVSTKILKAISYGVPVLTTELGVNDMPRPKGILPIVVASGFEFFETLAHLYQDLDQTALHAAAAEKYLSRWYSEDSSERQLAKLIKLARSVSRSRVSTDLRLRHVAWEIGEIGASLDTDSSPIRRVIADIRRKKDGFLLQHVDAKVCVHADVYFRYVWPPDFSRPKCCPNISCKLVIYIPRLHEQPSKLWLSAIRSSNVDKFLLPSSYYLKYVHEQLSLRKDQLGILPSAFTGNAECAEFNRNVENSPVPRNIFFPRDVDKTIRTLYSIPLDSTVFLYVARTQDEVLDLINAWCQTFTSREAFTLLIYTRDAPSRELISDFISAAELLPCSRKNILLTRTEHEFHMLLQAADVFVDLTPVSGSGKRMGAALSRGIVVLAMNDGAGADFLSDDYSVLMYDSKYAHSSDKNFSAKALPIFRENIARASAEHVSAAKLKIALLTASDGIATFKSRSGLGKHHICQNYRPGKLVSVLENELLRITQVSMRAKRDANVWREGPMRSRVLRDAQVGMEDELGNCYLCRTEK